MLLLDFLHFDDEFGSVLIGAQNVNDGLLGVDRFRKYFGVEETDIDDVVVLDEGIEQSDGGVLELVCAEDALEGGVDGGVGENRGDVLL